MAITPNTNLYLLKVPIEIDNKNQLTFDNVSSQLNYFFNVPYLECENFSYQRKDSLIRYPDHIDNILEYNYCMYQNTNYTNKWFFAFITNMRYVNNNMTEIYITTDVWQTWQFDLTFLESFVEREMIATNLDIPGANLEPEGLEIGEPIVQETTDIPELQPLAVIGYTRNPNTDGLTTETVSQYGTYLNGVPTGIYFNAVSYNELPSILWTIGTSNHTDAIMTIFTIPILALIGYKNTSLQDWLTGYSSWLLNNFKANVLIKTLNPTPSSLNGYTPRNKKLLTYPYCYLGFSGINLSSKIFRYEDFSNGTPSFNVICEVNQNPTVVLKPNNYRGNGQQDLVTLSGYPTLGWITEYYNTWLAQNSNIIELQASQEQYNYEVGQIQTGMSGLANIIGAGTSGGVADYSGSIGAGIDLGFNLAKSDVNHEYYIKNIMAQKEKQALLPNTGSLSGSNATLLGYDIFHKNIFQTYTIKKQFAEKIDKYFDMFGYQTNTVKIPNLNNRSNWNYIKTQGVNIHAYIPQNDLQIIKAMFDNGITLWHNPSTFLDYSQTNL